MDLATAVWLCSVRYAHSAEPHGGVSRHQIDAPPQTYKGEGEGAERSRDFGSGRDGSLTTTSRRDSSKFRPEAKPPSP